MEREWTDEKKRKEKPNFLKLEITFSFVFSITESSEACMFIML